MLKHLLRATMEHARKPTERCTCCNRSRGMSEEGENGLSVEVGLDNRDEIVECGAALGGAAARLFQQAYQQDGVLTNTEIDLLLKVSPSTVGKYVAQWEIERNQVLPRRGTIHDMGPSLAHKRIIIHKLFIEHHTVEHVAGETNHSFEAIQNYIGTFRQVLLCRKNAMTTDEIAFAIKRTPRLVKEYENIIDHYGQHSPVLNKLKDFHPKVK